MHAAYRCGHHSRDERARDVHAEAVCVVPLQVGLGLVIRGHLAHGDRRTARRTR